MAKKAASKKTATRRTNGDTNPDTTTGGTPPPEPTDTGLKVDGAEVFVSKFRRYRLHVGKQVIVFENGRAVVTDKALAAAAKKTKQFGTEFHAA